MADNETPDPAVPNSGKTGTVINKVLSPVKLELKDEAAIVWKKISTWCMILVAAAPDIYNAAVAAGYVHSGQVPGIFAEISRGLMFIGVISKIVQAKTPPDQSSS